MMRRRDILSISGVMAASLSGCSGILGGCKKPGDDLEEALPQGDQYNRQSYQEDESTENIERGAFATYGDSNENEYSFGITQFSNSEAVKDSIDNKLPSPEKSQGYIRVGKYVYTGATSDIGEKNLVSFMETSPPLEDCVENNLETF